MRLLGIIYRKIRGEEPEEHHTEETRTESDMPKAYCGYVEKNGFHFSTKLAEHASSIMKNADGSNHHWTSSQIASALSNKQYDTKRCTLGDMTYLANMAYADFYPSVIVDTQRCIEYAVAVANDPDGYAGMAFHRWIADVKNKCLQSKINWAEYE